MGSVEISAEEFRTRYSRYLVKSGLPDDRRMRSRFVERLVDDRLLAMDALASGAAQDPEFLHAKDRMYDKLLLDLYVRSTLYDTIRVRESELREVYRRMNTTLEARHLFARTRLEVDRLAARLASGEAWEDLAREVFLDSALADQGGDLGQFTYDEMDAAFENAAFALDVGEVSEPVRTSYGYSIIQLTDRFTHPLITESAFRARRAGVETVIRDRKQTLSRALHARDVAEALDISFDEGGLDGLLRLISGTLVVPGSEAESAWFSRVLLYHTAGDRRQMWTIGAFHEAAQRVDPRQRAQVRSRQDLLDFAEGLVVREIMLERARHMRLDTVPAFDDALEQATIDWLANYMRQELGEQDVVRTRIETLRARHQVHIDNEFMYRLPLTASESTVQPTHPAQASK